MLKLKNIHLSYGDREILKDLSLTINRGDIVAITGKTGSGKSSLLGIMSGLMKPTTGSVLFEDQDIFKWNEMKRARFRNRKLGFVFQFFSLFSELNSYNNIIFPAVINPFAAKGIKKHVDELSELLGIDNILKQKPGTLSGGERQRVAIARAIINHPEIIIADEPTGNLDEETGKDIINIIMRLRDTKGITTVLVTHDKNIIKYCDIHYVLEDGKLNEKEIKKRKSTTTIKQKTMKKKTVAKKTVKAKTASVKKTTAKKATKTKKEK